MLFKVFFDRAKVGIDLGATLGKDEIFKGALVGVPCGENAQYFFVDLQLQNCLGGGNFVQKVTVGEHYTLGSGGCA